MAYPTISAPYGLKPVNLIGGQSYAGSTRLMQIKSGVVNAIYFGDLVQRDTDGTIIRVAPGAALPATGVVGVFVGCTYVNAQGQQIFAQYCPAGLTPPSGTIQGYVVDDPDALFKVAVVSAGTAISGVQYSAIGENAELVDNGGSTTTGDAATGLLDATAATASFPVRIVDVVPDTAYVSGGNTLYPEVIVKINAPYANAGVIEGGHSYRVGTGN